jgi:hypothetical protein
VLKEALSPLSEAASRWHWCSVPWRVGDEGPGSDVDVLLVGEIGFAEAVRALHEAQSSIGREINPVVLSPAEFQNKLNGGDTFLAEVLGTRKIFLIGNENEFGKLAGDPASGSA